MKVKAFTINVPLEKAIMLLYALEAPRPVLNAFLSKINDAQQRMVLAKRVNASKSVIDSLIEMKEGNALEAFIGTLETGTELRFYAEHALKSMVSPRNRFLLNILYQCGLFFSYFRKVYGKLIARKLNYKQEQFILLFQWSSDFSPGQFSLRSDIPSY